MPRGKIVIKSFGGRINIVPPAKTKVDQEEPARPSEVAPAPKRNHGESPATPNSKGLFVPANLVNLMEIRAESIFRPNEADYEISYALSGGAPDQVDMLHKLASNTVVSSATPVSVQPILRAMVAHIVEEREGDPLVIVDVHTHPQGIPEPSDTDRSAFLHGGPFTRSLVPGAVVLYGVHAVSSESVRSRERPAKTRRNRIRWTSITREHEIAFFDEHSVPYEVQFNG